ncbi:hypothetical protein ABIE13_002493 [Ottowia thiooxydans]|uniref:Uncharacterized protein n=1 Tax=Ottowia thiooxydans TaxID=219182 RepID=A0ABV2Q8P7_9BURK
MPLIPSHLVACLSSQNGRWRTRVICHWSHANAVIPFKILEIKEVDL